MAKVSIMELGAAGIIIALLLILGASMSAQTYISVEPDILGIGGHVVNESLGVADANGNLTAYLSNTPVVVSSVVLETNTGVTLTNYTVEENGLVNVSDPNAANLEVLATYDWGSPKIADATLNTVQSGFSAQESAGKYTKLFVIGAIIATMIVILLGTVARAPIRGGVGGVL